MNRKYLMLCACSTLILSEINAGFLDAVKSLGSTASSSDDTSATSKPAYVPQTYAFQIPNENCPDHDMKLIYTPLILQIDGPSQGLETQISNFKEAMNKGLKDIIKAKKFTIFHEIEDVQENVGSMSQTELMRLAMTMKQNQTLDDMLTAIPYVKKKKSSALVKTFISITLKYEMQDASNALKSALVGNKIKKGFLHFAGEVGVEYIEPMTKEILIQQKFKLKEGKAPVQISYNDQSGIITWETTTRTGSQIYSTDHVEALDKLLHDSYTDVMKNYFEYLSPEELMDLKGIIAELKSKKNY